MTDLLESVFHTFLPTWDNCHQLLMSLFTAEERRLISTEAQNDSKSKPPKEVLDVEVWTREVMPEMRPNWDFNTREGQEILGCFHDALQHGLRAGAKKPTNMSKIIMIIQTAEETLADFYERLCEVLRTYTLSNPETAERLVDD